MVRANFRTQQCRLLLFLFGKIKKKKKDKPNNIQESLKKDKKRHKENLAKRLKKSSCHAWPNCTINVKWEDHLIHICSREC